MSKLLLLHRFMANLGTQIVRFFDLRRAIAVCLLSLICCGVFQPAALAGLTDDRYEGDIFALFGGNGSLVPPRVTLKAALERKSPTLLIFYIDDSSDCKQYSPVISQLQAFYGRVSDFIALRVDSIPPQASYAPDEPGYYYQGFVPQTVLLDENGKVVLDKKGILTFEQLDDQFRKLFDLLPRSESAELKRRAVNEITTELVKD